VVRWAVVVLATVVSVHGARAQRVAATELQLGVSGIVASEDFWGVEAGVARRPGGQARVAVAAALGSAGGALGVRVGATAQFILKPAARSGATPYAGVGLAFAGAERMAGAGYLAAMLGVETTPGRRQGWYIEIGLGGGVRVAAGLRVRRFPAWW
jgi:hypothetical protein